MKRVLCLYRVSTIGQVDHDDIPMQRIACREFIAQRLDWELVEEVSEKGVSGYKTKTEDRDALVRIKEKALAKAFDILLVFMFDRLGRRDNETPFVVQWFVENGIEVWSTKEGEQRFDNHVDKLLNYIRFWQASGESEKTSMRIRTKHLQMVHEGLYRGGFVPFGYALEFQGRVNKKNQPVRDLVVDENESRIVKEIFHKIVSDGWGTNRIANWLNDQHISTKRSRTFWRATSIRALVRNPVYIGRIRFGKDLSDPFEHLRIIDDDLFERCDLSIAQRAPGKSEERTGHLRSTSNGLLTGILFCGSCGERLCFNHNTTVRKLADGTVRSYERDVYRCYRKVNSRHACQGQSSYVAERVENDILAVVREYFANIRTVPTVDMLKAAGNRTQKIQEDALAQAEATLKKAQAEMIALEEATVKALTGDGIMDISFINGLIPKRKANLESALREVERIRAEIEDSEKAERVISHELQAILSWADTFDSASLDTKRSIIAMLIDRIVVRDDYELDVHFRITAEQYLGVAS